MHPEQKSSPFYTLSKKWGPSHLPIVKDPQYVSSNYSGKAGIIKISTFMSPNNIYYTLFLDGFPTITCSPKKVAINFTGDAESFAEIHYDLIFGVNKLTINTITLNVKDADQFKELFIGFASTGANPNEAHDSSLQAKTGVGATVNDLPFNTFNGIMSFLF